MAFSSTASRAESWIIDWWLISLTKMPGKLRQLMQRMKLPREWVVYVT
jgi:hypothetical protein